MENYRLCCHASLHSQNKTKTYFGPTYNQFQWRRYIYPYSILVVVSYCLFYLFLNSFPRVCFYWIERKRKEKGERKTWMGSLPYIPRLGIKRRDLGMCPDLGLNPWPYNPPTNWTILARTVVSYILVN